MPVLHHKLSFSPTTLTLLSLLLLWSSACGGTNKQSQFAKSRSQAQVSSFTEASPVRALAASDSYLFVATADGLERWDLQTDELLLLSQSHGLPGSLVYSMAHDRERDWLWIATDGGVTSYELATSSFSELPAPPGVLKIGGLESSVLAPALDGGVWVGTPNGLFYGQAGRAWTNTAVTDAVNSIYQSPSGTLWIGTDKGLLSVTNFRTAVSRSRDDGCDFVNVRSIREYSDTAVIVLAKTEEGEDRVALVSDKECATYETSSDISWVDIAHRGDSMYLMSASALFQIGAGSTIAKGAGTRLATGRLPSASTQQRAFLRRVTRSKASKFPKTLPLLPSEDSLPNQSSHIASNSDRLFVATRMIGTLEWDSAGEARWFRQSQIVAKAKQMSVACEAEDSCYIAHGGESIWHWTGQRFDKVEGDRTLHVLLRLENGKILGVRDSEPYAENAAGDLVLSYLEKGEWRDIDGIEIDTPGKQAYATSLRSSPDGTIWFALGYDDDSGARVGYGVASVDLGLNVVSYHRASFDEAVKKRGVIAVPVDVTGIGFVGEEDIWLASTQGASRVMEGEVELYNEGNGLRSELLYAIVCSSGGMVYTASGGGIGEWDGDKWTFPKMLMTSVRDLVFGQDGRLWFATSQGLGVYDGQKARRLDTRRGLVENDILELESDHYGRIWARSEHGMALITP
ncbi:MAG: hypothetical protein JKY56_20320 [Kofleriaceae bacterium]|nr:hypothetical protein [Kofleriaceae bacterium]